MRPIGFNTLVRSLKQQAKESAIWRGHALTKFQVDLRRDYLFHARCKKCTCSVTVNAKPWANEIGICGDAVAINCLSQD